MGKCVPGRGNNSSVDLGLDCILEPLWVDLAN